MVVDLGSGIGNIKDVIPDCLRTDLFPNPWIDQVENAYALSFADGTVSDLVLFDVFHHLRYPGTALREFERVLRPGGRVLIFDPFISLLGLIVYGLLHQEPIGWRDYIDWFAPKGWSAQNSDYYAAQGNTTRIFFGRLDPALLKSWKVETRQRFAAFSHIASGGYSGPQLYPESAYPFMRSVDRFLDQIPPLFATRTLVVLEKV
ncbi:MAG: class I SAM-dependent methyltransferase [Chloroflexi bacterium]|nr:MAG: class I SAM-dependent methyltransferase [Chloroflexota bacterium]